MLILRGAMVEDGGWEGVRFEEGVVAGSDVSAERVSRATSMQVGAFCTSCIVCSSSRYARCMLGNAQVLKWSEKASL
jgi:hypothetical protein